MKKLLLALAISLTLVIPVNAQQASPVPVLLLCTNQLNIMGIPVSGLSVPPGQTPSASNVTIGFLPSATADQQAQARAVISAFPWAMNTPNVAGFILAVNADPLSTANNGVLIFQMAGMLAIFQADMSTNNFMTLQGHWANAIKLYGAPSADMPTGGSQGQWLTTDVQTMLLGYANAFNIPLVTQ
jgi:hypothetical protein